jgi:hypothetical protein
VEQGRAASPVPATKAETLDDDSNYEEPMRKRMKKLINVIKPQSQDDTAHNKTVLATTGPAQRGSAERSLPPSASKSHVAFRRTLAPPVSPESQNCKQKCK